MGWPKAIAVQLAVRAMSLQGRRWEEMKRRQAVAKRKMNTVEESASLEKFVGGVMAFRNAS